MSKDSDTKILRSLKKLHVDVALLQETHLLTENFDRLKKNWVGEVIGFSGIGRKSGVIILIKKCIPYTIQKTEIYLIDRRISVTITHNNAPQTPPLTITNVYVPNSPTIKYFKDLTTWFQHNNTMHILGGDFSTIVSEIEDRKKTKKDWLSTKQYFDNCQENLTLLQTDHRKLKFHKFGNRPGKMLSYLKKEAYTPISIPKMKNHKGDIVTNRKAINDIFKKFHQNLYLEPHSDKEEIKRYLINTPLPTISTIQLDSLNAPRTETEIHMTISQLAKNKAPGPDGYTREFYKLMEK